MKFFEIFRPHERLVNIYDIDVKALYDKGFRALICDLDNTLMPWNVMEPDEKLLAWAKGAIKAGFEVIILSNNRLNRVKPVAEAMGISFIANARKPFLVSFRRIMDERGLERGQCVLIGDQLITDMLGGKRAGFYTMLVDPIDPSNEHRGTNVFRAIEKPIKKMLKIN